MSFASMVAKIVQPNGRGPYMFRVHGQIYHRTSHMHPNEGRDWIFAQRYAIESEQTTYVRARNHANVILVAEIFQNLDNTIRENNVLIAAFKTLHEVELLENEQDQNEQRPMFIVSISFNRDRNADKRRFNLLTNCERHSNDFSKSRWRASVSSRFQTLSTKWGNPID